MVEKRNDTFVTPKYVLNGISSRRWIKPVLYNNLSITGGDDISCDSEYCMTGSCATNYCGVTGCPTITRAFYNVSEDGDVYLVTANGVIYYLANDTVKMRQVYPVNTVENLTKNAADIDETGLIDIELGMGAAQFTFNPTDMSFNIVVVPSFCRVIPWRPGTTKCNVSVGEHYMNRAYVIQKREQMSFPYSNGYFCVQTDYNRCVVFYKGELIYDGEYNGMGLPLSFSYGLEKCVYGGSVGCCPHVTASSINWDYRVMPKWRKKDGEFVYESSVDKFFVGRKILDKGRVVGSNIFHWQDGEFIPLERQNREGYTVGYYADDSYQKLVVEVTETYQQTVRDEYGMPIYEGESIKTEQKQRTVLKEVDFQSIPGLENSRRFDIYAFDTSKDSTGKYIYPDCINPNPIAYFAVPLQNGTKNGVSYLRGTLGDVAMQKYMEEFNKLMDTINQIKDIDMYSFLDLFRIPEKDSGFSLLKLVSKIKNALDAAGVAASVLKNLLVDIKDFVQASGGISELGTLYDKIKNTILLKQTQLDSDIHSYQTFVASLFNNTWEGGMRIWWSPTIGTGKEDDDSYDEEDKKVFCNLREEEKCSVPKLSCESEMMYRCWEQLKLTECSDEEKGGVSPSYLKWYTGIGYTEKEGNITLQEPVNYSYLDNAMASSKDVSGSLEDSFSREEIEQATQSLSHHTGNTTSARQTLWLSRWRNELCVYCDDDNGGSTPGMLEQEPCPCTDYTLASNPYTTNNNCKWRHKSNDPGVCGKCNYPASFKTDDTNYGKDIEEPCWIHVPDIYMVDGNGNPILDENGKPRYKHCVSYRLNDNGDWVPQDGHFTHYCNVAVARVALDYLGGRVESIPYYYDEETKSTKKYTDIVDSDWGFIRIGATDCRVKKDYTVIGRVDDVSDIPGISVSVARKDGQDIVPSDEQFDLETVLNDYKLVYETNPITANAVILRAPGSINGDKETGCVPGFADGEGEIAYVMMDKTTESYQRFRFYHIDSKDWDMTEVSLPSKSELNKSNKTLNDCYCVDYYTATNKYTSKTSPTKIETTKETITYVQSTNKVLCYMLHSSSASLNNEEEATNDKLNLSTKTNTLTLGSSPNGATLYKVGYKNDTEYVEDIPVSVVKHTFNDLGNVTEWYKLGETLEVEPKFTTQLSLPSSVQISTTVSMNPKTESTQTDNSTENSTETSSTQAITTPISSMDLSAYESTGEEYKALVLYDVEKDFLKEFNADWESGGIYEQESLTSETKFVYNNNGVQSSISGGSLCCTGIVTIKHKYKIKENDAINNVGDGVKNTAEKYSHHEDTYTITRYLFSGHSYKTGENEEAKEHSYYTLEENVTRTLNSKRILSVEYNGEGSLIDKLMSVCDNLDSDSSSAIAYLQYLPVVAMTAALTEQGLQSLCDKISAAKDNIAEEDVPVDSVDIRKKFLRFFPAFMTRPDYIGAINDGVLRNSYDWTSQVSEQKCAKNTGIPSTSSTPKTCEKLDVMAPVNVTECYYNTESERQPQNENSKTGAYTFKGFTNNWLIERDKLEYERKKKVEEEIQKALKNKKKEKIIALELAKIAVDNGWVGSIEEALANTFALESYFGDTLEETKQGIRAQLEGNNYSITPEEDLLCSVTLDELGNFTLSLEAQEELNAKFKKPNSIMWYAKWEYKYTVNKDKDGVEETAATTDNTEGEEYTEESIGVDVTPNDEQTNNTANIFNTTTYTEMFYVPIPSPAGECYPLMVGSPVVNNDTSGANGKLESIKEVGLIVGYSVNSKGELVEKLETHRIVKEDVGKWFCFGTFTDYHSALQNYGGIEKVVKGSAQIDDNVDASVISGSDTNPYSESAGIKWVQAVNNWGDPHGVAIRGGTQMGDVYYIRNSMDVWDENDNPYSAYATSTIGYQYGFSTADLKPIITAIRYQRGIETYITTMGTDETSELESTYLEDMDVNTDKYWYWNGCEWVEGTTYFSDIDGEEVIFYKDKGNLNIAVENSGEKCLGDDVPQDNQTNYECTVESSTWNNTNIVQGANVDKYTRTIQGNIIGNQNNIKCYNFSKAIFKGKVKPGLAGKQACGDILAINLNADKTYHKAVFLKEKPIWDRPAYSGEDYTEQKEVLRCLGMTYTVLTYNVGYNRQCFRLWYRDYDSDTKDNSKYVTFTNVYTYYTKEEREQYGKENIYDNSGDVPDVASVIVKEVPAALLRKYRGREKEIAKTYLTMLSRNKQFLYVFYKGVLIEKRQYSEPSELRAYTREYYEAHKDDDTSNMSLEQKNEHTRKLGLSKMLTHSWADLEHGVTLNGSGGDVVYAHPVGTSLLTTTQGPKYCVIPVGWGTNDDYFDSLVSMCGLVENKSFCRFEVYKNGSVAKSGVGYVHADGAFVEMKRCFISDHYKPNNAVLCCSGYGTTYLYSTDSNKMFVLCRFLDYYDNGSLKYTKPSMLIEGASSFGNNTLCAYLVSTVGDNVPNDWDSLLNYENGNFKFTYFYVLHNLYTQKIQIDEVDIAHYCKQSVDFKDYYNGSQETYPGIPPLAYYCTTKCTRQVGMCRTVNKRTETHTITCTMEFVLPSSVELKALTFKIANDNSADYGVRKQVAINVLIYGVMHNMNCAGTVDSFGNPYPTGDTYGKLLAFDVIYFDKEEHIWTSFAPVHVSGVTEEACKNLLQNVFSVFPLNNKATHVWFPYDIDDEFRDEGFLDAVKEDISLLRVSSGTLNQLDQKILNIWTGYHDYRQYCEDKKAREDNPTLIPQNEWMISHGYYLTQSEYKTLCRGKLMCQYVDSIIKSVTSGGSSYIASRYFYKSITPMFQQNSEIGGFPDARVVEPELSGGDPNGQNLQNTFLESPSTSIGVLVQNDDGYTNITFTRYSLFLQVTHNSITKLMGNVIEWSDGNWSESTRERLCCANSRVLRAKKDAKGKNIVQTKNGAIQVSLNGRNKHVIDKSQTYYIYSLYGQRYDTCICGSYTGSFGQYNSWLYGIFDVPCGDTYNSWCASDNGGNCDRIVSRDIGEGLLLTQGGNSPVYLISYDGVRQVGENFDLYANECIGGNCGNMRVRSYLCHRLDDGCGMYYTAPARVNYGAEYTMSMTTEDEKEATFTLCSKDTSSDSGCNCYQVFLKKNKKVTDGLYESDYGDTGQDYDERYAFEELKTRFVTTNDCIMCVGSDGYSRCMPTELVLTDKNDGTDFSVFYVTRTWYNVFYLSTPLNYEEVKDVFAYDVRHTNAMAPVYAKCCYRSISYRTADVNNYVVLSNGKIFYKTKMICDLKTYSFFNNDMKAYVDEYCEDHGVSPSDDNYRYWKIKGQNEFISSNLRMNCCSDNVGSDGVLFAYKGYQCLFIEGQPVYPFTTTSSDKRPHWISGKGYTLGCCGHDYYWLQCGSFRDKLYYTDNIRTGEYGSIEDMYYICTMTCKPRSYDNPSGTIPDIVRTPASLQNINDDVVKAKIEEWTLKYESKLKMGETACVAFLKRNTPLRKLEDDSDVQIAYRINQETGEVDEDDVKTIDLTYSEKEYNEGVLVKETYHYRQIECPQQWSLCANKNIKFQDDYYYDGEHYKNASTGDSLSSLLDCIKMEKVRYVPWKHIYTMKGRECYAYYRTTLISADPRIRELCCFRHRNINVDEEHDLDGCSYRNTYRGEAYKYRPVYYAIGAYAIFGDNPFYDAWADEHVQDFTWVERTPASMESAGSYKYFEYHYTETETVQNVLGVKQIGYEHNAENRVLCDVDDYYVKRGELNESNLIPCDNENPGVYDSEGSTITNTQIVGVEAVSDNAPSNTGSKPKFITGSLYDVGDKTQRFCNMKGITKEAQKNICMIVWSRSVCQTSYMKDDGKNSGNVNGIPTYYKRECSDWHKNDEPFDELWDGSSSDSNNELYHCVNPPAGCGSTRDYWIRRLRSDIIYINDYNAACRWDRASGDDPVDDWQGVSKGEFALEKGIYGGFWTSAPDFHDVRDSYNDNLNPCGRSRLAVSGNNTLYVFDSNGRTDYDLFNGKRRKYPEMDKMTPK